MNTQNFTKKSIEAIQNAQQIAISNQNNQIESLHLLYALLTQEQGLIPQLLTKMNVSIGSMLESVSKDMAKLPKVSGPGREVDKAYVSSEVDKVLNESERIAKKMSDEYISVEHIMLALMSESTGYCETILKAYGVDKKPFETVLMGMRGNTHVTSEEPEGAYDVLNKYG